MAWNIQNEHTEEIVKGQVFYDIDDTKYDETDYLRDLQIYSIEGKNSIEGIMANYRARDYEYGFYHWYDRHVLSSSELMKTFWGSIFIVIVPLCVLLYLVYEKLE